MNIFRFVADMLHLAAIIILLYRIKTTGNSIGKFIILTHLNKSLYSPIHLCLPLLFAFRYKFKDPRDLFDSVLGEICRLIYVLCFPLQHLHEAILHYSHFAHNLPAQLLEALLFDL